MTSDQAAPDEPAEPAFTRSPEFISVFCDLFRTRMGTGECAITFSKTGYSPGISNATNVIEERAEVILSWSVFKIFVLQMTSIIAAAEEVFGPVPIPAHFAATADIRYNNQVKALRELELV